MLGEAESNRGMRTDCKKKLQSAAAFINPVGLKTIARMSYFTFNEDENDILECSKDTVGYSNWCTITVSP